MTTLALAFAIFNAGAPHRLRFLICFVALCSWTIPWGQIAQLVPDVSFIPGFPLGRTDFDVGQAISPTLGVSGSESWMAVIVANAEVVLLVLTVIGCLLFIGSSVGYVRFVRHMSVGSIAGEHLWANVPRGALAAGLAERKPELRIQRSVTGAVTTGILSPTIWINEDLVDHPDLAAALIHECRHVRDHDNAFLWGITLIERLFWWNPLVRILSFRARRLQELGCDEACAKELAGYRDMLNRLIVASFEVAGHPCPQTSCIHHSNNFNVQRLRALERRYVMKMRHYMSAGLLILASSITVSWALAQDAVDRSNPLGCRSVEGKAIEEVIEEINRCTGQDLGPITSFKPGTTMDEAERLYMDMKIYAELIQRQWDRQEETIKALEAEIEALKKEPQFVEDR